ncbi:MAG: hypothetical protein WCQ48_02875 [Chloroflexota bacterium]
MHRLAIYGWDDQAQLLLNALQHAAPFTVTAVGDRSASALVRARAATGSPCYQHVLEMFRGASYDAALLMANEGAAQAAEGAANAGAAVLLAGDRADGLTMIEAAEATMRARVPFAVLRPRLQRAGIAFLASLAASDAGWRPRFLDVSMAGPGDAMELARDVTALANRLMLAAPISAVGSAVGDEDLPDSTAVTAELRYAEGLLVSLRARTSSTEQTTLFADCPLGELELRSHAGVATLTVSSRDGRSETSKLTDSDTLALEARRATRVLAGDGTDALLAPRDGSVLLALERSLETGQVVMVEERSTRANLVLVEGHGVMTSTPRGRLHVVAT